MPSLAMDKQTHPGLRAEEPFDLTNTEIPLRELHGQEALIKIAVST